MKKYLTQHRCLLSLILILFFAASIVQAQITSSVSSGRNRGLTEQAKQAEVQVLKITDDAGRYFKQGLFHLQDNRRSQAREDFNKSVEVFLVNGVNIERSQLLFDCYQQLIETIYRMEFPGGEVPQIRTLSGTCGWNIDSKLADEIAELSQKKPVDKKVPNVGLPELIISDENKSSGAKNGFTEQEFRTPAPNLPVRVKEFPPVINNISVVKAQSGDTVESLAKRHGANPVEVAKFNGLFVNSKLSSGTEIRIPAESSYSLTKKSYITLTPAEETKLLGVKPTQAADGKIKIVIDYFNENLNDPYSMRFVRWFPVEKDYYYDLPYWVARVKFRAKNAYGAYMLFEWSFLIQKGKVIKVIKN